MQNFPRAIFPRSLFKYFTHEQRLTGGGSPLGDLLVRLVALFSLYSSYSRSRIGIFGRKSTEDRTMLHVNVAAF